jgi:hypothetical protein
MLTYLIDDHTENQRFSVPGQETRTQYRAIALCRASPAPDLLRALA